MVQGFNFKVGLGLTEHDSQSQSHKLHNILWTRKHSCNARVTRNSAAIPGWLSAAILDFIEPEITPFDPPTPRKPHTRTNTSRRLENRLRSYGHFCISKMAISRHLKFYRMANSAIRSIDPQNPSLEPNMEWIGCTVCDSPLNYTVTLWGSGSLKVIESGTIR